MDTPEATEFARIYGQEYGKSHSYVAPGFVPHEWVVQAVKATYERGYRAAYREME